MIASAAACASTATAGEMDFSCRVEGETLLRPAASADAVCAVIKARLDRALGTTSRPVGEIAGRGDGSGNWLRVQVRFARPGVASAILTRGKDGAVTSHPELNVAVSDRALGLDTVEQLASDLAGQLG